MKVKINKVTARTNTNVDEEGVPYNCTAIRCHLHSDAEIAALTTAIYEINTKYGEKGDIHISRSARYVGEDGSFTTDLMIAYGYNSSTYRFNHSINYVLLKHKIDFEFINPRLIEHNVDDTVCTCTAYHLVIDRAMLSNEFFEFACKQIGFEDVDDIECIHIPLTKAYVTRKLVEGTIDTDGRKNIRDTKFKASDKKDDKKPSIMNFNIAIFDNANSDAFDKLIMDICSEAVIDITADYTEIDGDKFFRTVYMRITDDPAGRSLYTTAAHYGCVNVISDDA